MGGRARRPVAPAPAPRNRRGPDRAGCGLSLSLLGPDPAFRIGPVPLPLDLLRHVPQLAVAALPRQEQEIEHLGGASARPPNADEIVCVRILQPREDPQPLAVESGVDVVGDLACADARAPLAAQLAQPLG